MTQGISPIERYMEECEDDLLKQLLELYNRHKYAGKEEIVKHMLELFATTFEEKLNAAEDED
jgi:hypothetical protein